MNVSRTQAAVCFINIFNRRSFREIWNFFSVDGFRDLIWKSVVPRWSSVYRSPSGSLNDKCVGRLYQLSLMFMGLITVTKLSEKWHMSVTPLLSSSVVCHPPKTRQMLHETSSARRVVFTVIFPSRFASGISRAANLSLLRAVCWNQGSAK